MRVRNQIIRKSALNMHIRIKTIMKKSCTNMKRLKFEDYQKLYLGHFNDGDVLVWNVKSK